MEIRICITANIIYLVRELYLGDRIGGFSLLERWVVTSLFIECHFPSVLWPLAGDVQWITCSFIALALDIHVFCLRAEAEGAHKMMVQGKYGTLCSSALSYCMASHNSYE